jgi:uncharacterized protein YdeI (YjbR/CyaY-like superfamily)
MVSMADRPVYDFTIEQWEAYLAGNPDPGGVRLKLRKKNSSAPGITWSEALDVALCYGWIDGQANRLDEDYTLNGFVARLIEEGRMRPAGIAEIERAKADGRWDAAYRQRDAVAPADLQAALDANTEAAAYLASLTKVERFRIYFRLGNIKTPAVRAARIRDVVEKAARGEQHYR